MGKAKEVEKIPPEPAEPIANPEDDEFDLVEHLKKVRARRAYEKFLAIKGTIHLNIDIDELRGRNR